MLHSARCFRRSLLVLGAVLSLSGAAGAPGHVSRAQAAFGVAASPSALSVSLPLGQVTTAPIALNNGSGKSLPIALYEAYPDSLPALALQTAPPPAQTVALPRQDGRVDPRLLADLRAAASHTADFVIYLRDQADLSAAERIRDWNERGSYVYRALREHAEHSQRELRAQLAARGLHYRPLWIVNAVLVHGDEDDARALAVRADVALVRGNHTASLPPEQLSPAVSGDQCSPDQPGNSICWNIRAIGADRVWRDFGVAGQGVVVANIDTGVAYDHPALAPQYRGYLGPGRFDHDYGWFDALGIAQAPADSAGHGTHVMGTIVGAGSGSLSQPSVGVAPRARWIAAAGCGSLVCDEASLIAAAQWILAPTDRAGQHPRPDLRPMIVNNSWAGPGGSDFYSGYVTAWRAAGIFPVYAAGNTGPACQSIASPADNAGVVAVGATNMSDSIASFSSRGPAADKRRKPDFTAPGMNILSTYPGEGGRYEQLQGTSMATPHVAGLVALLWSANPSLIGNYDATYALIRDTARPIDDTQCGDAIGAPNSVYGYGRIDAYAAVARARVDVPWLSVAGVPAQIAPGGAASFYVTLDAAKVPAPGSYQARVQIYGDSLNQPLATITIALTVTPAARQAIIAGRVVSATTGAPVAATVAAQNSLGVATDSTGAYTLTLAPGSYDLVATAPSFVRSTLSLTVEADLRAPDIVMQPLAPRMVVPTTAITATVAIGERLKIAVPIGNAGNQLLYYQARVLPDKYAIARSDEPGGPSYAWIDLPPDAVRLALDDDGYQDQVPLGLTFPFYSHAHTETLVASNGALSFFAPISLYPGMSSACLPDASLPYSQIAPFRADLDPSRGGAVRYGTVAGGKTFVVSYERVPLHGGPRDQTYTFQVLLHADGRIVFQYQALAAPPAALAVGLQNTTSDFQVVGCGVEAALHDRLAIELRPQAAATSWLQLKQEDGLIQPAGQQSLGATLSWSPPNSRGPLRARIEITGTDPDHPRTLIPLTARMLAAPHSFWIAPLAR